MENELVPNSVSLAGLRRLLKKGIENAKDSEVVKIELSLWRFSSGVVIEKIGVYRSGNEGGTEEFQKISKANAYIDSWKEEETDANSN